MKLIYALLSILLFSLNLYAEDNISSRPIYIKIDDSKNNSHTIYEEERRTFEEFDMNSSSEKFFTKNEELYKLYSENYMPSFVILYNRLLDNVVSQPTVKVSIPSENSKEYNILQKIYLPINAPRSTLFEKELWKVENHVNEYFHTQSLKTVDRSTLMRIGKISSNESDTVREIEIKSLSKGADYIVEILFAYNKDFKIKVISLYNGEVIFSDYYNQSEEKSEVALSRNNDFHHLIKEDRIKESLTKTLNKFTLSLIEHFKLSDSNKSKSAEDRINKQDQALSTNKFIKKSFSNNDERKKAGKATGSGFFITNNGYIITNSHVVKGSESINIEYNDIIYEAKIIEEDKHNDVALLKIELLDTPFIPIKHNEIKKGIKVCALGYPLTSIQGKELKATFGHINSLSGIQGDTRFLQVDTSIQPGNSGGPLVNMEGNVVGIITSKLNEAVTFRATGGFSQNVNYALNINYILPILKKHNIVLSSINKKTLSSDSLIDLIDDSVVFIQTTIK